MRSSKNLEFVTAERTRVGKIHKSLDRIQAISQIEITILVQVINQLLLSLLNDYQKLNQNNLYNYKTSKMCETIGIFIRLLQHELGFHHLGNNIFKLSLFSIHARQLPTSLTVIIDNFNDLEVTNENVSIVRELYEWVKGRCEKYESVARNKNFKIEQDVRGFYPAISVEDDFNSYFSHLRQLDLAVPIRKLADILEMKLSEFKPLKQVEKLNPEDNPPQILLQSSVQRRAIR